MNLLDQDFRKKLIADIKNEENIQRKVLAYKKYRIQQDDFYSYVFEYLVTMYGRATVKQMAVFNEINLQKRISNSEASIYNYEPKREVENDIMLNVYNSMSINSKMKASNVAYKYLDQCTLKVKPYKGSFKLELLHPHQFDVIADPKNPEHSKAYIISNMDTRLREQIQRENDRTGNSQGDIYNDQMNQLIGDPDDKVSTLERYYVWSKDYNFCMNGKGEILDKDTEEVISDNSNLESNFTSPLAEYQIMPFIDIVGERDYEYWVRSGNLLMDGTIKYNVMLSSEFETVSLQGFSQAYFKGPKDAFPQTLSVGKNKCLFIPVLEGQTVDSEFAFASPSADLAGSLAFRQSWLAAFLSSRGLDTNVINSKGESIKATSGIEKLLQMVEKFEASQSDFSLFRHVEKELYKVLFHYTKVLQVATDRDGNPYLNQDLQGSLGEYDPKQFYIEFHKPEAIKTKVQELEEFEKELDLGLNSRVHYLMDKYGMNDEDAIKYLKEIEEYNNAKGQQASSIEEQSLPGSES